MHPAEIKAALTIAGYKQTEAAVECGVAPTTIGAVINGRSRSKPVEEWIATVTGIPLIELWPQWYGEPALVLTSEEQALVKAFRGLSRAAQKEVLEALKLGSVVPSSRIRVSGVGNRVAGRDYSERKKR